jgi:hypothetical protein
MKNCAAAVLWMACALSCSPAGAHSASDAYLTLTAVSDSAHIEVLHGQWDIALRDLDFVLSLDDNGDGHVTWGETKHHQSAIEHYAYSHLHFADAAGQPCAIKPTAQLIDAHADGAYAALFFDVTCARSATQLKLDYQLFFGIDPSHRGIFVMHDGDSISTSVLSPQNAVIDLAVTPQKENLTPPK